MLLYHIKIALKSLRRTPVITALLIGGIAVAICLATAFVTLRHMYTQDPVPGKTDKVFYVRLDSWSPEQSYFPDDPESIPDQVTYLDARGLMQSPIPVRQTPTFYTTMFVHPDPDVARPFQPTVRLAYNDLFEMFEMPFRYGGPWSSEADERADQVAVIDHATNQTLFGGEDSVGRTMRLEDRDFRIVGVLAPWRPPLRWFELNRNASGEPEAIYLPFNLMEPMEIWTRGNDNNWKPIETWSLDAMLTSERVWLQYWAELPDRSALPEYREWIRAYIAGQKEMGRFGRPVNFRLSTVPELIEEFRLTPEGVRAMSVVSLLFLVVCSLNLVGILLGKFLARVPEVSVRRALGASRGQIFWQHIVECQLIGAIGGALGVALSVGVIELIARNMSNGVALRLNGEMLLLAAFLSLATGLIAGLYPAWRVSTVPPAMQLKVQ